MYAGAFALEALSLPREVGWRLAAAAVLIALGTLCAVQAWTGWPSTEKAMRRGEPLPGLAVGAIVVGVVAVRVLAQ